MAMKTSSKRKSTSAGPRRSGTLGMSGTTQKSEPEAVEEVTAAAVEATAAAVEATEAAVEATAAVRASGSADDDRLKRPDLIEAIAKRVSLKRSEAKMVFDVVLDEIGKALDASDEVVVPPLGKLMVKKRLEKPGGNMLTIKLKRADADPAAGDVAPLADVDEDS